VYFIEGKKPDGQHISLLLKKIILIAGKKIIVFLLLRLYIGFDYSCAQNTDFIFKHITKQNGLAHNGVTALCQDSDGFMWIGTWMGLQRYDGTRFKNYLPDIRDTAALHTDLISAIFEDSKKRFWIGTNAGPYLLNRATGKFYNYNLHAAAGTKIIDIWHFAEDKLGGIWIAGHDGYFKLDETTNQFVAANTAVGLKKNERTGGLVIDKDNNFWMLSGDGLNLYNTKEKRFYNNDNNPGKNPLFNISGGISSLLISKDFIWVSVMYSRVVYQYNFSTKKIKTFSFDKLPSEKNVSLFNKEFTGTVFQLKNGQIVVALPQRGLAFYHPESDNFTIVNADNNKMYAYHTEKKTESGVIFLQDNEQNVLIGNQFGINIYNPGKQQFFTHGVYNEKDKLFPKMPPSDFLEMPNGDVLISYESLNGGIVRTDSAFNLKKHYLIRKNETEIHPVNQIWNLFKDAKGIVWAATQAKTIVKFNTATEELREETDTVLSGPINTIKQDEKGIIWAGHWSKGLVKIDEVTHTKQFFTQFKSADTASHKRVYRILPESNKIWVGTLQNGLQVFDKTSEKFTESYETDERNKDAISSNVVKDIIRYNKDTLLIATFMGVNIFDIKTKKFTAITVKEGLSSNLVEGIMLDKNKNLWVVSAGGDFCRINMRNLFITKYDVNDGIIDDGLWGRVVQLKNGTGLIASAESFISFNPESIAASAPPANVLITGCSVFEKDMAIDSLIKSNNPLQLSYQENSLRIEFASLDFWNPGSIKYFYKLNGIDKDWITADKNNVAIYNQLTNGEYIFEIKCANRDGIYSKGITQLKIKIKPPFWKTWWFIMAAIFINTLLVYRLIKWREKNIKTIETEKLKVQQLSAEKLKGKLELEQIVNYFSSSLVNKHTVDDVLWDAAKNLISQLGFTDCMMYLWNSEKTKMEQRACYGPKDSVEKIAGKHFDVSPGQGVVGYVIQTKEPVMIADTSADDRYRIDDIGRLSEIAVPIMCNDELLGVIDSEHPEKNFFTDQHMQVLTTIATLLANKIKSLEVEKSLQDARVEMYSINQRLSEARLEALRSQMNPHFIFNSLNAIQECILTNKVDAAYEYLSRFSKLQRMVLNNSAKEFITLGSELEMLQLYLSLESLRFSQSFTYTIHTDADTDVDEIMLPSMIIQPYVENAIWHGLRNKAGDKILTVTCKEIDGELIITIDDNGVGREKAAIIKSQKLGAGKSESKGTILSAQRLNILALQYKASIHLEVTDKVNEANEPTGTTVVIRLPSNIETIQP